MKLTNLQIRLLENLFKSDQGLYAFTLFQRLNVSPKDLFNAIVELVNLNFAIEEADKRILLSPIGKEYVISHNMRVEKVVSKSGTSFFIGRKLAINEFYLPKGSYIEKGFLQSKFTQLGGTTETSKTEV